MRAVQNPNSKETHPMCKLSDIFSEEKLKTLSETKKKRLRDHVKNQIETSSAIHKILIENEEIRNMIKENPPEELRAALRTRLKRKFALKDF